MTTTPQHLYVERCDPAANCARFYALSIERSLFGDICLVRRWGRIGSRGRSMTHPCGTEAQAVDLFHRHARRRHARGYRPPPPGPAWIETGEAP